MTDYDSEYEAAMAEFLEYGFKDASMRRIASAAGMSVSGLYKHFASKEDMFAALVEPACEGLLAAYAEGFGYTAYIFRFVSIPAMWMSWKRLSGDIQAEH